MNFSAAVHGFAHVRGVFARHPRWVEVDCMAVPLGNQRRRVRPKVLNDVGRQQVGHHAVDQRPLAGVENQPLGGDDELEVEVQLD